MTVHVWHAGNDDALHALDRRFGNRAWLCARARIDRGDDSFGRNRDQHIASPALRQIGGLQTVSSHLAIITLCSKLRTTIGTRCGSAPTLRRWRALLRMAALTTRRSR